MMFSMSSGAKVRLSEQKSKIFLRFLEREYLQPIGKRYNLVSRKSKIFRLGETVLSQRFMLTMRLIIPIRCHFFIMTQKSVLVFFLTNPSRHFSPKNRELTRLMK